MNKKIIIGMLITGMVYFLFLNLTFCMEKLETKDGILFYNEEFDNDELKEPLGRIELKGKIIKRYYYKDKLLDEKLLKKLVLKINDEELTEIYKNYRRKLTETILMGGISGMFGALMTAEAFETILGTEEGFSPKVNFYLYCFFISYPFIYISGYETGKVYKELIKKYNFISKRKKYKSSFNLYKKKETLFLSLTFSWQ